MMKAIIKTKMRINNKLQITRLKKSIKIEEEIQANTDKDHAIMITANLTKSIASSQNTNKINKISKSVNRHQA